MVAFNKIVQSFPKKAKRFGNIIGICSSSICLIHCLATPLLLTLGLHSLTSPWTKYVFIFIAFLAIYKTTIHSPFYKIAILLWVSFWIFLFSLLFENTYPILEYPGLLASVGIITGHILNIRYGKRCKAQDSNSSNEKDIENPS
jgi:hypothetical protein